MTKLYLIRDINGKPCTEEYAIPTSETPDQDGRYILNLATLGRRYVHINRSNIINPATNETEVVLLGTDGGAASEED